MWTSLECWLLEQAEDLEENFLLILVKCATVSSPEKQIAAVFWTFVFKRLYNMYKKALSSSYLGKHCYFQQLHLLPTKSATSSFKPNNRPSPHPVLTTGVAWPVQVKGNELSIKLVALSS